MTIENDDLSDHPEDEYRDDEYSDEGYSDDEYSDEEYSEDDSYAEDQFQDEEYEEDQRSSAPRQSRSKKRKRRMFCGSCHRMENHKHAGRKSWFNSYITGLTFGINRLCGPFKCTCCGHNRWIIRLKKSNVVVVKK